MAAVELDGPSTARPTVARAQLDEVALTHGYGLRSIHSREQITLGAGRDRVRRAGAIDSSGRPLGLAVKVLHPDTAVEPGALERSLGWERAAWAAGVSMPEPLLTTDGAACAVLNPGSADQRRAVVRRWVRSTPVDYGESLAVRRAAALEVGASLARLHRIPAEPDRHLVSWAESPVGRDRWNQLLERARRAGSPLAAELATALPRLERIDQLIAGAPTPRRDQLTHNDCAPHNGIRPLPSRSGGRAPAVMLVDWDGCCGSSAGREFTAAVARWAGVADGREQLSRDMVRAYRDAGGEVEFTDLSDFTAHLASMVHWLEDRLTLAVGDAVDERNPADRAAASAADVMRWLPEVDQLPRLLEVMRRA